MGAAAQRQIESLDIHRLWQEVLGKVDVDATRQPGLRDLHRSAHQAACVLRLDHLVAALGDAREYAVDVEFVPKVASQAEAIEIGRED